MYGGGGGAELEDALLHLFKTGSGLNAPRAQDRRGGNLMGVGERQSRINDSGGFRTQTCYGLGLGRGLAGELLVLSSSTVRSVLPCPPVCKWQHWPAVEGRRGYRINTWVIVMDSLDLFSQVPAITAVAHYFTDLI